MPSIATRKGDDGTTSLLYGQRVPKDHPQIEALGACDELNVALGMAKSLLPSGAGETAVRGLILRMQRSLVALMGEVACAESDAERYAASKFERITPADLACLDEALAMLEAKGLRFDGWATPGATPLAAAFDFARTTARRAERRLSGLSAQGRSLRPVVIQFINRVSDVLWLLARDAESVPPA